MALGKTKARELLAQAKEARRAATMENASFAFPGATVSASGTFEEDGVVTPDEYIKDKTRLYMQSWVIYPLDCIIAELERHV